ncbi:cytochrome c biogenesis protein [Kallotenue papyrolyticum]|uniref:cytochrome c biogenesis protein n=1 Tax=Kallotenue papyrolyticum TaxID=1325125 RepID=UPI000492C445|nr:cytochrome c biogenesis protein [Kallotenue papyrolyticum]
MLRSQPVTTALKGLVTLWLLGVVVAMFLIVPEYQGLGNTGRIIMVHVPTAWLSMLAFSVAAWQSVQYLRRRRVEHDERALAATELGLLFATLATLTGSMFAKVVWGAWWNWEPRETSILILLLIYAAYFALRSAIDDAERRRQLAAVYALFAFVTAPLLIFVVPRLYDTTLHPNCAFLPGSKCDGITLAEGRVGDLGDNILELRAIRREGDLVTAVVAVRGTGGAAPVIMEPSYNVATRTQVATPAFEGSRFMLAIQGVSDQGVRLNIQAPGNTSQRNATTTLTLLASLLGFTGLFVWIYALRSTLLSLQRRIEAQGWS